mmetsp:Transcript_24878/g.59061  ORF Transcript_24878/g.59061 Transcript_24878/m.59061 type:complete len:82 (-) Transcript_24878:1133-1378(-)
MVREVRLKRPFPTTQVFNTKYDKTTTITTTTRKQNKIKSEKGVDNSERFTYPRVVVRGHPPCTTWDGRVARLLSTTTRRIY